MADRIIKITIHNGEVKIEAEGFKGKGCDAATKVFAEGLPSSGTHKSEFYQTEDATLRLNTGGK